MMDRIATFSSDEEARAHMARVVADVKPITERMTDAGYRLRPGADVTLDRVREAIFMATGCHAREVAFVSQAIVDRGLVPERTRYRRTLDRAIESLCGFRLVTRLGGKRYTSHRRHFGYEVPVPLMDALSPDPALLPSESLRSALFHYWGFALANDGQMLDRLTPLVRLLPDAIPLGELPDRPGVWLVMTA
jgi:hypothetical protein